MASPGPATLGQALVLMLKGLLMGAADIVPGVSGGTMAFITGIYDNLVDAVRSFGLDFIRYFFSLDFKRAVATAHLRFLLPLGMGILISLVTMSRVIHYFMANYPAQIYGFFFGMILASVWVVDKGAWPLDFKMILSAIMAFLLSFYIAGEVPATTSNELWFVFFCGALAICAMILPGISGAFILLLLGKYQYITGALKNPFADGNMFVLAIFALGLRSGAGLFFQGTAFFSDEVPSPHYQRAGWFHGWGTEKDMAVQGSGGYYCHKRQACCFAGYQYTAADSGRGLLYDDFSGCGRSCMRAGN